MNKAIKDALRLAKRQQFQFGGTPLAAMGYNAPNLGNNTQPQAPLPDPKPSCSTVYAICC
jgi:hypothetical protein